MKSPQISVLDTLSRQLYASKGILKSAYLAAMSDTPYNYILIYIFIDDLRNRLRSSIFYSKNPLVIWRPSHL